MKVIKLYSIQSWDGGDRHNHKFYLTSKKEADKWHKKNTYDAVREVEIEIFDTLEEWEEWEEGNLRERALSKLTEAERRALGF